MNNTHAQESVGIVDCMYILKQETVLLERLAGIQEKLRISVFSRDWTDLEFLLEEMNACSKEFETMERERVRIFTAMNNVYGAGPDSGSFYSFASQLPEIERKELTELYRRLKLDSLKVRLSNDTLMEYLNNARTMVSGFLEAAFPDRKGRMYSRKGTQVQSEMSSIVLDRSF